MLRCRGLAFGPAGRGYGGHNDRNGLIIRSRPVAVKKALKRGCLRVDHGGTRTAIPARETYLHDEMDDEAILREMKALG